MSAIEYSESDHEKIRNLLLGRTVTKVSDDTLVLDDGHHLKLVGHDGGCACSAGCYDLTELNGVDNIITKVEFNNDPAGDDENGQGVYQIFVFAGNNRINLATFEGSDGNGYYGTGYSITVTKGVPIPSPQNPKKKIRILLTPEQWSKQTGVYIQDADGWHAGVNGYPGRKMWNEPITEAEFHARAAVSTVLIRREMS